MIAWCHRKRKSLERPAELERQDPRRQDPWAPIDGESRFSRRDRFLALKDVNFEVKQGERLGIIVGTARGNRRCQNPFADHGSNKGTVKMRGHVTSLLEVGTRIPS
jgi:ABC-type polysaccharide/polyol phosphate transport system ATPase subunit